MTIPSPTYRGRFAPSPTGPLHFGSLVAAVASYLDARAHGGEWLLRMEDLDPPREEAGARDAIVRSLTAHGLHWDGPILYQSERDEAYWEALAALDRADLLYPCQCTRRQVAAAGGRYPGHCRPRLPYRRGLSDLARSEQPMSLRLRTEDLPQQVPAGAATVRFQDLLRAAQAQYLPEAGGDFIVFRKDRLFAYQLAVAVDDVAQNISHVIRGSDLLGSTPAQIFLLRRLGAAVPEYGHLPLARDAQGQKLSKQQGAAPLDDRRAAHNLSRALAFLRHPLPTGLQGAAISDVLDWAVRHWDRRWLTSEIRRSAG